MNIKKKLNYLSIPMLIFTVFSILGCGLPNLINNIPTVVTDVETTPDTGEEGIPEDNPRESGSHVEWTPNPIEGKENEHEDEDADRECPYEIGDIITFGKYEQDADTGNGKEEIEWRVLDIEEDRVLLISEYALDCKQYNTEYEDSTWETCSLRKWMNDYFYNEAFSSEEKEKIPLSDISTEDNPVGTSGTLYAGEDTQDYVFNLSVQEVEKYFGDYTWINEAFVRGGMQGAICSATKYAEQQGVEVIEITRDDYSGSSIFALKNYNYTEDIVGRKLVDWWTRTPGKIQKSNSVVGFDGTLGLGSQGRYVNLDNVGVRPAIYMYY